MLVLHALVHMFSEALPGGVSIDANVCVARYRFPATTCQKLRRERVRNDQVPDKRETSYTIKQHVTSEARSRRAGTTPYVSQKH